MELSFAVARSREKTCGICMETVLDKPKGEARYFLDKNGEARYVLFCAREKPGIS
jgi:E3 ubiquitin-protein ligase makorin